VGGGNGAVLDLRFKGMVASARNPIQILESILLRYFILGFVIGIQQDWADFFPQVYVAWRQQAQPVIPALHRPGNALR
jgi:hypothetical protein